jgi:Flp pilus assembly protein CpaB
MKQKNMVLMVVAIGCGLVAAFLTAQLGAKSSGDQVEIIVAANELPQGTKLDKLDKQLTRRKFPRDAVPPSAINDPKELEGKILNRTLRLGDHFTLKDVTNQKTIDLPAGYNAMAIKATIEVASHFVQPGSRVNVVLAEDKGGVKQAMMILQNVLVVAVGDKPEREEGKSAHSTIADVTLAVKPKEGVMLALASKRGDLRLLLRDEKDESREKIGAIIRLPGERETDENNPGAAPGLDTVQVPVAAKDIPAGTKIDNPEEWFREQAHPSPAPPNAVIDMKDLKGKFITAEIAQNQWVPTKLVADKYEATEGTKDDVKVVYVEKPVTADAPKAASPKGRTPNTHVMTGRNGGQTETHIFKDGRLDRSGVGLPPPAPAPAPTPAPGSEKPADSGN